MKRSLFTLVFVVSISLLMTSCYTLTYSVGEGSKTGVEVREKNHFVIFGLVPLDTSNPTEMAAGAANYTVTHQHTFIDGLVSGLTMGIYNPTTTVVRK